MSLTDQITSKMVLLYYITELTMVNDFIIHFSDSKLLYSCGL